MFKYAVILFLTLPCIASEPKFHFGDCVKIRKGFFKGCRGHASMYVSGKYEVDGECGFGSFHETFEENELERCRK
jgi:hypothetical protein